MATAALLGQLLNTNTEVAYYTQQQIFWSNKYELNAEKLQNQVKYETKWCSEYDKATEEGRSTTLKAGKYTVNKDETLSDYSASLYASAKVSHYDRELSIQLAALDLEYETMKEMYETMLESLRAKEESEKTATSTSAQDTGLLNAG